MGGGRVCALTLAVITHHCWQRKRVRFGVRQRGASDRHGNRLTDSAAAVWVGVVGVGGGMADPDGRGVCGGGGSAGSRRE